MVRETHRRILAVLGAARLPPPNLPRYGFAVYAGSRGTEWILKVLTQGGEVLPLTGGLIRSVYVLPAYLYGATTCLLTATSPDLSLGDLVRELEVLSIHSARGVDGAGQVQLRSIVTADTLDDPLVFVTTQRPAGWPP